MEYPFLPSMTGSAKDPVPTQSEYRALFHVKHFRIIKVCKLTIPVNKRC